MAELAVFIGGIHGTGKSVFASNYARESGLNYVSASDIIYNQNITNKKVENVDRNQDVLVAGFYSLPDPKYVMDGHYTLLDKNNAIARVPLSTFVSLNPKRLILLISEIEQIYARLLKRDGRQYSLELLSLMQNEEKKYYYELCEHFDLENEIIINNFNFK